jgi:hypothetical protein
MNPTSSPMGPSLRAQGRCLPELWPLGGGGSQTRCAVKVSGSVWTGERG